MKKYIHELKDWPDMRWSIERLAGQLAAVRHHQGRLIGRMEALGLTCCPKTGPFIEGIFS